MAVAASTADQLQVWSEQLLENVNASLATTVGGAISRAFVSPGLPVLDCCPQLTVDVRGMGFETTTPQNPISILGKRAETNSLILATMVVTIARCLPEWDANSLPSEAFLTGKANETSQDVFAAWNGIQQGLREGTLFGAPCMAVYLDPAIPLAPSGGCSGWVLQLRPAVSGYSPA